MKNFLTELLGWIGVICILGAYILLTLEKLDADSVAYQFLNLFGAIAIMIDAFKDKNYQPVFLNLVWGLIALLGLVNAIF